jgi:hypothetical protein
MVPDTHPVLNNFKYHKKVERDGAEVELNAYNLKEKFFLIEGIEELPLEATRDSGYSGNDPLVQAQHFSKLVGLNDKITIKEFKENSGKEQPVENKPTNELSNSLPKELNDKTLLEYFQKNNVKSIKLENNELVIEYNGKQEKENKTINNQELEKIKSLVEKLGKNELSLSDLESSSNTNSPDNKTNTGLWMGGGIGGMVIISVIIGLFLKRKNRTKKH